jgi:hypothetical protein
MIPNRFNLNSRGNLRLTGIVLALLAAIPGGPACLWAQPPETPIIIGDGSLTIESSVPWSSFTGSGAVKAHPHAARPVASVDIAMPAMSHTVTFSGEKTEIDVTYAGSFPIAVLTGNGGKNLAVKTDFSAFHPGADANHLSHNNTGGFITHVTVLRNGTVVFDSSASGHPKIVVHFQ